VTDILTIFIILYIYYYIKAAQSKAPYTSADRYSDSYEMAV